MTSEVFNQDCMIGMAQYPDKYFDLAVVDPPYGLGKKLTSGGTWASKYSDKDSAWDIAPPPEYFIELKRISKNYIVWGGNYFSDKLIGSRCFLVWRKIQMLGMHTMADCELALTSFDKNAKIFDSNTSQNRIHPTQKPIELYKWIYHNYLPHGGKVIDTHLGSGSNRIAAHSAGNIDFVGYELDKDYFEASEKRYQQFISQQVMQFPL